MSIAFHVILPTDRQTDKQTPAVTSFFGRGNK